MDLDNVQKNMMYIFFFCIFLGLVFVLVLLALQSVQSMGVTIAIAAAMGPQS